MAAAPGLLFRFNSRNRDAVCGADRLSRRVREQRMTTADYNYDRAGVSSLVRRIGREQGVPPQAFDAIERFVDRLPDGTINPRSFRAAVNPELSKPCSSRRICSPA